MTTQRFPRLDDVSLRETRDALHAYARVLGEWMTTYRSPRKHWWQGSLRPSLRGLTTGVIYAGVDFELELDLQSSELRGRTSGGGELVEALAGQPAGQVAARIRDFLGASGLDTRFMPAGEQPPERTASSPGYSAECAQAITGAWGNVARAMTELRAGIREETSPIQLWPHHFDLSMVWLPGDKLPDQDPENAEYADKQMNFGFTLGDDTVAEPYFYVTAYPSVDAFSALALPPGTTWRTDGFSGAVLTYDSLMANSDPHGYLLDLWKRLLVAGRQHLVASTVAPTR